MQIKDVAFALEQFAPKSLAESYDNVGLLVGEPNVEVTGVLLTLDITEKHIDEAVENGLNMIISHHPIIFSGLKSITGKTQIERIVLKAIRSNVALYACHTNIDSAYGGVSYKAGEMLGLEDMKPLVNRNADLLKLSVFVPTSYANIVRDVMSKVGVGQIGNYDSCSFSSVGKGRFRANSYANPFVGAEDVLHTEEEEKIESILPRNIINNVLKEILAVHPYEEPAFDIIAMENTTDKEGLGIIGTLPQSVNTNDFLIKLKEVFGVSMIRHSDICKDNIREVAICGGSGASFVNNAIIGGADIYITGDVKYHDFSSVDNALILCDIGHFESEQFTIDIFYDVLMKKFTNFAIYKSKLNCNPINYL